MKEKATIFDYARMCKNAKTCDNCPLGINNTWEDIACGYLMRETPDEANEIILNWCKEHPVETRQDRFLKIFPNADLDDGVLNLCPTVAAGKSYCNLATKYEEYKKGKGYCFNICQECHKEYWLAEVKENE